MSAPRNSVEFFARMVRSLEDLSAPVENLLARMAAGDVEALIALICSKLPIVEGICRSVLGETSDLEFVAGEVFILLWRFPKAIDNPAAFDGWLRSTARNVATKMLRSEVAARRRGEAWERERQKGEIPADPVVERIEREEVIRRIRQAIAELPASDQQVLHAEAATAGDGAAAETLGLQVATYRTRLHRARQKLRRILKRMGIAPVVGLVGTNVARAAAAVRRLGRTWMGLIACLAIAGLTVWGIWQTSKHRESNDTIGPLFQSNSSVVETLPPEEIRRRKFDGVVREVAPRIESHLKRMLFGNQASTRFREARDIDGRIELDFDWNHRDVRDGKVSFEKRSIVRFIYGPIKDSSDVIWFVDGDLNNGKLIKPKLPLILWQDHATGLRISVPMPPLVDAVAEMEAIRREFVLDKEIMDAVINPIIPEVERLLGSMALGNEGSARWVRTTYDLKTPQLLFEWRHREVRDNEVAFNHVQWVAVIYWPGADGFELRFHPLGEDGPRTNMEQGKDLRVLPATRETSGIVKLSRIDEVHRALAVMRRLR